MTGTLTGFPARRYVIELFGNAAADGQVMPIVPGRQRGLYRRDRRCDFHGPDRADRDERVHGDRNDYVR